jgi:hypothetical protein
VSLSGVAAGLSPSDIDLLWGAVDVVAAWG